MSTLGRKIAIGVVGSLLVPALAWADHSEPAKAKRMSGEFVTSYALCSSPDLSTDGLVNDACTPVRTDPVCGFGPSGHGAWTISAVTSGAHRGVRIRGKLTGLDAGCEGTILPSSRSSPRR
jgi:hypothetical protein